MPWQVVIEQLLSFAGVSVDRKLLARAIAQHTPALMNITPTTTNNDNQKSTQSLSIEVTSNHPNRHSIPAP